MFIGIDHGTTAMRFAGNGTCFKIPRKEATGFQLTDLLRLSPDMGLDTIEGIALTYSMGDNFSSITRIQHLKNRGLISHEGAGEHTGGGTRVFDEVQKSGLPAVAIPGLHRGSPTDPRFKAYSHQASPEKIGIAYEVVRHLGSDCIVCDISSNTVSLLVKDGRIIGGFDACLFAPGRVHGALDLDAIRSVDFGEVSANEAFLQAGVSRNLPQDQQIPALAMFAAMECASLALLAPGSPVALCGSLAEAVEPGVTELLGNRPLVLDEWTAARGLSNIAKAVFEESATGILGIPVEL
ncbi:MAG: methanogenesis marker 12 protein [Methanospirillum sp.]|uniref:methanogenesis marker 12 protein n=1 Tax=Methanospirillum sp. TaxID=45200 RepID=UPI00236ADF18|nr:methanogenesis marker 12 protein [Methanospirillum sp.]MDD1727664.1 methanogenesis marker 12 protein [Methanospirillum sp.]